MNEMPIQDEDYLIYDSDDEESADSHPLEEARRHGKLAYLTAAAKHYAKLSGHYATTVLHALSPVPKPTQIDRSDMAITGLGSGKVESKRFKAPKGKKIHVPVRVEPKVYFAAERTFLSWLEFSIYISASAGLLMNFGDKPTRLSFIAAGSFMFVAILALIYSVGIYLYRRRAIRERKAINYHDWLGPSVLCGALFIAILVNAGWQLRERGYLRF